MEGRQEVCTVVAVKGHHVAATQAVPEDRPAVQAQAAVRTLKVPRVDRVVRTRPPEQVGVVARDRAPQQVRDALHTAQGASGQGVVSRPSSATVSATAPLTWPCADVATANLHRYGMPFSSVTTETPAPNPNPSAVPHLGSGGAGHGTRGTHPGSRRRRRSSSAASCECRQSSARPAAWQRHRPGRRAAASRPGAAPAACTAASRPRSAQACRHLPPHPPNVPVSSCGVTWPLPRRPRERTGRRRA